MQTVTEPSISLVNVHDTASPGSISMVAVPVLTLMPVPLSGSMHWRLVSAHPATGPSMTVHEPGATEPVFVLESVPSLPSSSEKAPKQVPENEKSCASFEIESLVMLIVPLRVFVIVQVLFSPAASITEPRLLQSPL